MRYPSQIIALLILMTACLSTSALADKRVALLIGNSSYRSVAQLENPKNDAKLMAETLRALGFSLIGGDALIDLDKANFDRSVQQFGELIQGADVALFYYAGHGVQVRGENYLVPVDANPTRESDVDFQMMSVNLVLHQMAGAGTKLNLVILDACRNNPFGGRGLRDSGGGLAQVQAPEGTLISYATQPGSVARDGSNGNSPYTQALAQTIKKPGLGIFDAFNEVGLAVMQSTGSVQQPWVSTSPIKGNFYFSGQPANSRDGSADAAASSPATAVNRGTDVATAYWQTRQIGTCGAYQAFMQSFAGTFESKLAQEFLNANCRAGANSSVAAIQPQTRTFRVLDNVSEGKLNMRSGPGTGHALVAAIPAGANDVNVGSCQMPDDNGRNPWCKVAWRGQNGWASACCMVDTRTGESPRLGD